MDTPDLSCSTWDIQSSLIPICQVVPYLCSSDRFCGHSLRSFLALPILLNCVYNTYMCIMYIYTHIYNVLFGDINVQSLCCKVLWVLTNCPFVAIYYLFIWPHQILVEAHEIFNICSGMWTLSCCLSDLVSWTGIEPRPLHWQCGVLVTRQPGKSLQRF